ncbi:MAG: signal recognition particle subunit SRP19/SEC65 family protein [Nitrososphaeraceae archaeon]
MKDYNHIIIWLDYFNKNLTRKKGRRVKKENAIYDPIFSELLEAADRSGIELSEDKFNDSARYPRRPYVRSGYVMLSKNSNMGSKCDIIEKLASQMISKRMKNKKNR